MWVNLILLGFHVIYEVNDAITLYWHLLHSSLSGTNKSKKLYTVDKKKCVREMAVMVGFFSGHPGCYLVNLRAFPTIDMMQPVPFY